MVVSTQGPAGAPTNVLSIVDAHNFNQGIYQVVPVTPFYRVSADIRVDRFSTPTLYASSGFPMAIGTLQLLPGVSPYDSAGVQLYADALTAEWRLFAFGTAVTGWDFALGLPVVIGQCYRVQLELDAVQGIAHSRIWNAASVLQLLNRVDALVGWTPADGQFNAVVFIEGEMATATTTNLAVIDNLVVTSCPTGFPLTSDVLSLSLATGGTQRFCLDAGGANGGRQYLLGGSLSGTAPGIPSGPILVPLNLDAYLLFTVLNPNAFPLSNSSGSLNASGLASAAFSLPAGLPASLAGITLHHAFVLLSGAGIDFASKAVPLTIAP